MRRLLILCCLMVVVGCGERREEPRKSVNPSAPVLTSVEYLQPDCAACLSSWERDSVLLTERTTLYPIVLGRPGSTNERIAAITEWAHERNRSVEWLNVFFAERRRGGRLDDQLTAAVRRFGLEGAALEAAIRAGLPAARRNWKTAKRNQVRRVPTLLVQGRSLVLLYGGWSRAELESAFTSAADPDSDRPADEPIQGEPKIPQQLRPKSTESRPTGADRATSSE